MKKPYRGYWYMFVTRYCEVCGRSETYKYRVYDKPKPKNPWDRRKMEYITFCHCYYYQ